MFRLSNGCQIVVIACLPQPLVAHSIPLGVRSKWHLIAVCCALDVNIGIEGFDEVMNYIPGIFWFLGKTFFLVWILMWIKWTFPRLRIDQILKLEWKYLMPLGLINLVLMTIIVALGLYIK